jgi:2-iminobutanoate/2-iminopropanoate deaminase
MKIIHTNNAPLAIGPYSQAIIANGFIFCSGQIGIDPKTGNLKEGISAQTRQVLKNIEVILIAANSDIQHVVKTTIFITDMTHFNIVPTISREIISTHKPARATIEVSHLPKDALIEIEAIAVQK